jgi:type IV secretion system T-DNA border endonuclease VirD2
VSAKSLADKWLLKIDMAKRHEDVRRKKCEQDSKDWLVRAGLQLATKAEIDRKHEGKGLARQSKKSVTGLGYAPRVIAKIKNSVEEHKSGRVSTPRVTASRFAAPQFVQLPKAAFAPPLASNKLLAAGARPVVIKVVSYAGGGTRAGATAKYVQRDDVKLETQDSALLRNEREVEAEINRWTANFERRKPSQDVFTMGFSIAGQTDTPEDRETLNQAVAAALQGHHYGFAYQVNGQGILSAKAVVVMAGSHERFKIVEQGSIRRLEKAGRDNAINRAGEAGFEELRIGETLSKPAHGREGLSYHLRKLAELGPVEIEGKALKSVQATKEVAREWTKSLKSSAPRDTMHMVISAKADTDSKAFERAVRNFLHETFTDHKFMFGVHEDKKEQGHIHAHVIVAVRGENNVKLHPSKSTFLAWREGFAEKAQEQGLKMAATVAGQQASSQSYGKSDKAIVDVADNPRTERYDLDVNYNRNYPHVANRARHRMSVAKVNPVTWAVTEKQRAVVGQSLSSWADIVKQQPDNLIARQHVERLNVSLAGGQFLGSLLRTASQETTMGAQGMTQSLQRMNVLVDEVKEKLPPNDAKAFEARANKVLNLFATRVDLKRLEERCVESIDSDELKRVAGFATTKLVTQAREIARIERREASDARIDADEAINQQRKDQGIDPMSRELTALERRQSEEALQVSKVQNREAKVAKQAAQDFVTDPAKPISIEGLQTSPHLRDLKADQDRALNKIKEEAEREAPQKAKPTKQK